LPEVDAPSTSGPAFSIDEYLQRLEHVLEAMDNRGLDGLIAYGIQFTLPGHVTWLAGGEPRLGLTKAAMAVVLPGATRPLQVVGRPEPDEVWLEPEAVHYGFVFVPLLREVLPCGLKRVGIAGWEAFPTSVYVGLRECLPDTEFEPASDLLLNLRQIKSPAEVEVLRKAAAIAQHGVETMYAMARPGLTERQLLAEYERTVRLTGSDELPFATQVGAGPRTAQVTAHATDRVIEDGDIVRSDSGALYRGYCSDISRGIRVGAPDGRVADVLTAAVEAYEAGLSRIKPGVRFEEVADAARNAAARYGLAEYLGTLTVHGIGCNQDEYPHWSAGVAGAGPSRWTRGPGQVEQDNGFQEGMVCCFEPGIYVPGVGGLRLEEPFVVTSNGYETLTTQLSTRLWETLKR